MERERQQRQAARVKAALSSAGLPVLATETHIVPVMVGDAEACKAASTGCSKSHGIYIQPINYPTVPRGTERLRITPDALPYRSPRRLPSPGPSSRSGPRWASDLRPKVVAA